MEVISHERLGDGFIFDLFAADVEDGIKPIREMQVRLTEEGLIVDCFTDTSLTATMAVTYDELFEEVMRRR